jgi:hypothetical protein
MFRAILPVPRRLLVSGCCAAELPRDVGEERASLAEGLFQEPPGLFGIRHS